MVVLWKNSNTSKIGYFQCPKVYFIANKHWFYDEYDVMDAFKDPGVGIANI